MNFRISPTASTQQSKLTVRSVIYCALIWLLLALVELVPSMYANWAAGNPYPINQVLRSVSVYIYWFGMSLAIGYWLLRFPLPDVNNWLPHVGLAVVLAAGYIVVGVAGVKVFIIESVSEQSWRELFSNYFTRYYLGEFAVYALIAGAWQLSRSGSQSDRKQLDSSRALTIRHSGNLQKVPINEIIRLEALENYVVVHTENEKFIYRATLKSTLDKLGENFIQVHRSSAVNKAFVCKLRYADNSVVLTNDESVPVGRRRLASVAQQFKSAEIEM